MQIINEKGSGDRAYIAGLHSLTIGLYANSLFAAKQQAITHFKLKKKEFNLLWVEPADET